MRRRFAHSPTVSLTAAVLAFGLAEHTLAQEHNHGSETEHHQTHEMTGTQSTHVHHMHNEGMWMIEYNYMRMNMRGLRAGSSEVSPEDALVLSPDGRTYTMVPTEMAMEMHMAMVMYSFSSRLSAMAMVNYLDNDMDMIMTGMPMNMTSTGLGDTEIGLMYAFEPQSQWNVVGSLGLSIPTGSIDEKNVTSGNAVVLPYGMQLGSGTFDLKPSVNASLKRNAWEWGAQGIYTVRLGDNDEDYNLGDRLELTGYAKYAVNAGVTLRAALTYHDWKSIEGEDKRINDLSSSPNVPANYGGTRIDGSLGVLLMVGDHMVGAEFAAPIEQDLNGLQMNLKSTTSITYMYMF